MRIVSRELLRDHQEEIKNYVRKSSNAIIWQGDPGVLIVAANRDVKENRIHKIHDRIACLTRGTLSAGQKIWQGAVNVADLKSHQYSRGDVHSQELVQRASEILAASYSAAGDFVLRAEAAFAQIARQPEDDSVVHVDPEGDITTFQKVFFFGTFHDGEDEYEVSQKRLQEFQESVTQLYQAAAEPIQIIDILHGHRDLRRLIFEDPKAKRTEVVFLERVKVMTKDFRHVFQRLMQ